ncbi:MAG: hypothetical protein IJ093_01635 [Bacilli bacterium]|nr:hypothetical protein [Bacilli bacterium]
MASAMIHIAVASEINKKIKKDYHKLFIGSIAPDIAKFIGQGKDKSHFIDEAGSDIPNLEKFLIKYKNNLDDDFVMGYYIHLYTDYLWYKYFIARMISNDVITRLDGTKVKCDNDLLTFYMYNDYTNLNIKLIDEYNLNLKIFYDEIPDIKNIIEEIPMDKINVVVDNMGIILENTEIHKDYIFNLESVNDFINSCVKEILENLKNYRKDE